VTHAEIAQELKNDTAKIILAYAFNSVGKTRLCVAYKDATKDGKGNHTGVYYNAFSEDLFVWDNDEENGGSTPRLTIRSSSLNRFHTALTEDNIRDKLSPYKPTFGFELNLYGDDPEKGIESISFFVPTQNPEDPKQYIKTSRGEERIFVWCFFLALFEVEGWADKQASHFFIDDPVSSLDDHNIFVTSMHILDLIEKHHANRKIVVTTHHIGLYSLLYDGLKKGEKADTYKRKVRACLLSGKSGVLSLETERNDVFLYHLRVLQILEQAQQDKSVRAYHFALLRQVLENVSSFLGVGRVSFVLEQIGIADPGEVNRITNALTHKSVYYYESDMLVPDNIATFDTVFNGLKDKFGFVLHVPSTEAPGSTEAATEPGNVKEPARKAMGARKK